MRVLIAIVLSAAALAACTPESNADVTGSISDCARKLYSQYNPKDMKQCVAVCIACERGVMTKLPQRLINVSVKDRGALAHAADVHDAVAREAAALEGRGRVLVRPSGTESLVRVMVEAPSEEETDAVCERLVAIVRQALG